MSMLNIGERVRLRMGGELMTVKSLDADGVYASWFTSDGKLHEGHFSVAQLEVYQGELNSFEPRAFVIELSSPPKWRAFCSAII